MSFIKTGESKVIGLLKEENKLLKDYNKLLKKVKK
jgi:hypothetical protein